MNKLLVSLAFLALLLPPTTRVRAADPDPDDLSLTQATDVEVIVPPAAPPQWQQLFPGTSPSPRASHALAYDTAREVAVLFGGANSSGSVLDDTWEWHSLTMTWVQRFPVHHPPARYGHVMAYDQARRVTVLFGGTDGYPDYGDTWLWDGNDWTQVSPVNTPGPRWATSMTYDSQRQAMVLFGGLALQLPLGDTWEWDGSNWVEQQIPGPSIRCCAGLAYDPTRGIAVLFGGNDAFQAFNDTWERVGGGGWQEVNPSRSPSPRERPGTAYFPRHRSIILYGGEDFSYYDDTFLWDGRTWRTRQFDPRPAGRCCLGMVYDPRLGGVLIFGGSVSFVPSNDTWMFR